MIWQNVSLSDPVTVKGLLFVRHIYDGLVEERMTGIRETSIDANSKIDDITDTYIVLDMCIEKVKCTKTEEIVSRMYQTGFTEKDIAERLNMSYGTVISNVNRFCEKIVRANLDTWREYIYNNKVKVRDEYKQCIKCQEFKPMTSEYYYYDKTNEKFRERCKICV